MIEPVLVVGLGFDLFGPEHVVLTLHYPMDIENFIGPQNKALFLLQADQMKAIGEAFIEAANLSASMKNPAGSA